MSNGKLRNNLFDHRLHIAIAVVAVLLAASAINVYSISSNNVAIYNKWATVDNSVYTIFTDGTNFYAKNGATGAIDYSGNNAHTVIQNVLNVSTEGTVYIREGTYPLGTTGLTIANDAVKIIGADEDNTVFNYTGSGAAITIAKPSSTINRVGIERIQVNTDGAGSSVVAIQATQYSQFTLRDVKIMGDTGTAIKLDGGSTFSAYGLFENVRIGGSFKKAVYITGNSQSTNNANTFINVIAIYSPGIGASDTYGVYLEHGDTNTFIGGDLDSWGTGMKIQDGLNRLIAARFENNAVDMNFTASSHENMMVGVSEDASAVWVDDGTDNHRLDRFATDIPNVDTLKSLNQNTIMNIQSQRSVSGNAMIFQTENENFNGLLTRMAIQGGDTVANTKVQLTNAGLDMAGNNFKGIRSGSAATPSTSDILDGEWQIYKDTTTGDIKLCYNDAGTVKCTAAFS